MSMDLELMDWLNQYTFPEEEKYQNNGYARRAYAIFAEAMRKGATTRAVIFATRHREEATTLLMELMEGTGIVSYVGKVNMDREAPAPLREESALDSAFQTWGWVNEVRDRFVRTKPILTPALSPAVPMR